MIGKKKFGISSVHQPVKRCKKGPRELTGGWYETTREQFGNSRASLQTSVVRLSYITVSILLRMDQTVTANLSEDEDSLDR